MEQILAGIKAMTPDEVRKAVTKLPERADLRRKAMELCYDRDTCKALGINYNELPQADYWKAYLYAYKLQEVTG